MSKDNKPSDPQWVQRNVSMFSNEDKSLVNEFILEEVELSELQELWNQPKTEPMFACFQVEPKHQKYIEGLINIKLDFNKYSYFVEASCTDWEAMKSDGGFLGEYAPPKILEAFPDAKRVISKTDISQT